MVGVVQIRLPVPTGVVAVAIGFVADLPVDDAVVVGDVGILDPGGCLTGRRWTGVAGVGAVVDRDDRLPPSGIASSLIKLLKVSLAYM